MADLSIDFDKNFQRLLKRKSREFKDQTGDDIQNLLLSQILLKYSNCFPRFVVQSEKNDCPPPFGSEYYRYVMPEIGIVNGKRLFFEVINEDMPSVNLHLEKKSPKTEPSTIVYCKQSKELARAILRYLDQRKLEKIEKPIGIPEGFYVFEFAAQEHSWLGGSERKRTVATVTPFPAKSMKEAIRIFKLWPQGNWYKDLSNFRVCTNRGWENLNSTRRPHTEQWWASLSDYEISPK